MTFDITAFKKLQEMRRRWVETNRENGFEEGILRLLTQLYPDNAHFVYELLQNAEDAEATSVEFKLTKNSLIFEHDGKKLFTANDVVSITSFGNSTKLDSDTKIGKFGVGFKAVFAYTETPEIHSGEYHLKICDLFVPELINAQAEKPDTTITKFVFPFNNSRKSSELACAEISRALIELQAVCLLFLTNIKKISYVLVDSTRGCLESHSLPQEFEEESNGEVIEITAQNNADSLSKSSWLRYKKNVSIVEDEEEKNCTVAIAFALESALSNKKINEIQIIPLRPGRVSIFFPAEKEISNLRFHLHAPFASTVARDSVRDTPGNKTLIHAIADLAAHSMLDIRNRGLLSVSFLNLLPLDEDNLNPIFQPIKDKLIDGFNNLSIVPCRYGGHRAGIETFRGPTEIVNLLTDDELNQLNRSTIYKFSWCEITTQSNQRADKFLTSLGLKHWGWRELSTALNCEPHNLEYIAKELNRPERLRSWLATKDDAWLKKFYSILYETLFKQHIYLHIQQLPLVRAENQGTVAMVKAHEAFFPITPESQIPNDLYLVKSEIYSSKKSDSNLNLPRLFLESIGVKVFDDEANVRLLISSYVDENYPSQTKHLTHIKIFLDFFKAKPERIDLFKSRLKKLFLGEFFDSKGSLNIEWRSISSLYIDLPFEDTGLKDTIAIGKKITLWSGYEKVTARKNFIAFLKAVGVQSSLEIVQTTVKENPKANYLRSDFLKNSTRRSDNLINEDWTITNLDRYLSAPTIQDSRILWSALIRADSKVAIARYRPNLKFDPREAPSQLIHALSNHAWIPDISGNFLFPKDIERKSLYPGFHFDDRNGLLTAIGFEEAVQKRSKEYQQKDATAKEIGFEDLTTASEIALAISASGLDANQAIQLLRQKGKKIDLPEEGVVNHSRRRQGVLEHRENAPSKESVLKERSIQPDVHSVVAIAKAYLRAKYTDSNGQIICQICRNSMPFKLATGDFYFEAVQVVKGVSKNFYENRLSLCPTCAAKFQYARNSSDEEIKSRIKKIDDDSIEKSIEFEIVLADSPEKIYFVGTHFFDLKVVLE